MYIVSRKSAAPPRYIVTGDLISVSVEVAGSPLPVYERSRDKMPFVAAPLGAHFDLVIHNRTRGRLEIVCTVDGRDTLDNLAGDYRRNRGMVVSPGMVWRNKGWRLSQTETAGFVFSEPDDSVEAIATGGTNNRGVFGFAVFQDVMSPPPDPVFSRGKQRAVTNPTYESATTKGDLGTGMGQTVYDPVGSTEFVRQNDRQPDEIITMFYASQQWMVKNGILVPPDPEPFPNILPGTTGYAAMSH